MRTPALAISLILLGACGAATSTPEEAAFTPAPEKALLEDTKDNADVRAVWAMQSRDEASAASVLPVSDASATEWIFRFVSTTEAVPIYSSPYLNLYSSQNSSYLKYQSRDYGINLGWSSTQPRNITFQRAAGAGALRFGDIIAINVSGGGYLKYGSRTWGINLVWSSTPVYEWEVAGGPVGGTVLTNQKVRLINRTERNGMVYCKRPVGVNLAWQDNCTEALGYRILIDYLCSINPIC